MTTKRRKVLSLFLALILSVSALPISHVTAFAETSGDFNYSVISEADMTCQITGYTGSDTVLNIPSQLDGYTVTSIGDYAFQERTSLTDITIPDSVTSIGMGAFLLCTSLTSITIPDSVTSIGMGAFAGCTSLEKIEVDAKNSVYSSINGVLFNKEQTELVCYPAGRSNTGYIIPASVTSIDDGAFAYCISLVDITISNNVTSIGGNAFEGCTSLINVIIPDSVTDIGYNAFYGCERIKFLGFDNSIAKTHAEEDSIEFCLMGDIDGDGVYSSNDYSILAIMVKCQAVYTTAPREVGDINLDGAVDAFDAIQLDLFLHNATDIHGNKIA